MNRFHSLINKKLHIACPIIQAPLAGSSSPELVSAVSNAGALGSLGAALMSPEAITAAIGKIRSSTDCPFNVNLLIPSKTPRKSGIIKMQRRLNRFREELHIEKHLVQPVIEKGKFEHQIKAVLEAKVPIFSFAFGMLSDKWIEAFKRAGTTLIGVATTLEEALALEKAGIDMLVAQGCEASGHRAGFLNREEDALIGTMALVPLLSDRLTIPVIAEGGIMDGRAVGAALIMGAEGVQLGTAFLTTDESPISHAHKHALLCGVQSKTVLTRAFSGRLGRALENRFIIQMQHDKGPIPSFPIQGRLTADIRKKAEETGNGDFCSLWAGQGVEFCRKISCKELINALMEELEEAMGGTLAFYEYFRWKKSA